jgi:hypothetical protein
MGVGGSWPAKVGDSIFFGQGKEHKKEFFFFVFVFVPVGFGIYFSFVLLALVGTCLRSSIQHL